MYSPWRGCIKCSEGCLHCYIHKGDQKRGINTNEIIKTNSFYKPIEKYKNGKYKMKSGLIYMCFQTDFLIKEADPWRQDVLDMIEERQDCQFLFLTKRIERYKECIKKEYDNLIVGCTVENQKNVDKKLKIFKELPIKHKCIILQPLLENVNIEPYLDNIELVVVGGESDYNARILNYDWVLNIRKQCIKKNISFEFRQCGTHFIKDNKTYYIKTSNLTKQAKLANINYKRRNNE